jgi:hypothetical protein
MENKILKPVKTKAKKYNIAVFDIEAKDWINPWLIGFYDGEKYYEFYNLKKFVSFIQQDKYINYRIYAHNGGKYDFLFFYPYLNNAELIDSNSRIIALKITKSTREIIMLIDSYMILPESLEKLIDAFEVPHKKIKCNYNIFDSRLKKHCKNDCLALYEIINKFQDIILEMGGELKITLASTALDLFKRKYLNIEIPTYFEYYDKIRSGYYGGRCEVFKKILNNGFYYDINSQYPFVMHHNNFPVGRAQYYDKYRYSYDDCGFANIETKINMNYPVLPVHYNNFLVFPNGYISGWYPFPFLKKLTELKIPFKVNNAILFDNYNIFKNFVFDLYTMRKISNKTKSYIIKGILNRLYGKFGQSKNKTIYIINPDFEDLEGKIYYSEEFNIVSYDIENNHSFLLPAISAYVTAYGQLELYNYINDNCYYVDTDSVFTTDKINIGQELGELKLEDEIKEGYFITQKVYAYRTNKNKIVKKIKGYFELPTVSINDFRRAIITGDYILFNMEKNNIFGWKESLQRFNKTIYYGKKIKSIKNIDTKRIFNDINSKPLYIDKWGRINQ